MRDDIVEKLNIFLSEGRDFDERTTLYFFAEIRKIIEHLSEGLSKEGKKKIYPIVKFYADWCLHIRKNNTDDFRDYMEIIADAVEESKNMSSSKFFSSPHRHGAAALVEQEKLKNKLAAFLRDNGIDASFIDEKNKWSSFRNSLGKILINQPLDFGNKPVGHLKIKEVAFLKTNPAVPLAFLISMKDANDKQLGPFIFGDDNVNVSF